MEINFGHIGNSLGTRVLGKKIRLDIEKALLNEEFITFNFDGVKLISHSFADECFAKLIEIIDLEDLKKMSTFKNANGLVKKTIAFTIKDRLQELAIA
ncbi:STAS-like domain-containing protein [Croceibacter atlanticus]|uniref:STAS-like domain-containing protein n=1 Tax=Croceibacter atlanticus TaxID=313588 RepID=UPI0024BBBC14|nr:STAS-like domain-containing protein [Croceibacter atlanticus]